GRGDAVGHRRVERRALFDRLLQRLEDRFGQPLPLRLLGEDILAEHLLESGLFEVDAVELMLGGGDGADGLLADTGGSHARSSGRCSPVALKKQPRCRWRGPDAETAFARRREESM